MRGFKALAETALVVEILKAATERPRPTISGGRLRNHNADGQFFAGGDSFPSGHAAEAWTIAAVVSQQYSHRSWIPATAYSLAGVVSVSRLIERRHFPPDLFVGSLIGYLIACHVSHASSQKAAGHSHRRLWFASYRPPGPLWTRRWVAALAASPKLDTPPLLR